MLPLAARVLWLAQECRHPVRILGGEKWLSEKLEEVSFHAHKMTWESQTTDMHGGMQKSKGWSYVELLFFLAKSDHFLLSPLNWGFKMLLLPLISLGMSND